MSLADYWKKIVNYKGSLTTNAFVKNEKELLPFSYSTGKFQSYNTDDTNLLTIAEYIREMKPNVIIECGTFEARTTEYIAKLMRMHNSAPEKILVTIDITGCIEHINKDHTVRFKEEPDFETTLKIRKARLAILECDFSVKVIYKEGLTQLVLPDLMKKYKPDFVYEDANHLPEHMVEEFFILNEYAKSGCVVCFDDINETHPFLEWVSLQKNWNQFYSPIGHGQLWMEKK